MAPEYNRKRLTTVSRNRTEAPPPLANVKELTRQLVYGPSSDDQETRKGEDYSSGWEYESSDEEEADYDEVSRVAKEQELNLHMSNAKGNQASTMPQGRKQARSKTSVPTTTRTTRSFRSTPNQTELTPPNGSHTSPHQTSNYSNSPQANTEMQPSQDTRDTSGHIDNTVTLHGQDAFVGSAGPTNSESRRGKRSATIGHGLQEYVKRNGGRKMKIDFLEGRARPADSNQASKLTSECGIHTRNKMHVATHWKDYKEEGLAHIIPNAIKSVAKKFEMDTKDEVAKDVCTKIFQSAVRQQRYRLKRDCFKGRTVEEALSKRPHHVTQENWEDLVNKWSDERNQEISAKNKQNREAVKRQPKKGSRCYIAHFHQLKKDKYNNKEPSPIDFFKDTHIDKKTGRMSEEAQIAYTAMKNKRREAQSEGGT